MRTILRSLLNRYCLQRIIIPTKMSRVSLYYRTSQERIKCLQLRCSHLYCWGVLKGCSSIIERGGKQFRSKCSWTSLKRHLKLFKYLVEDSQHHKFLTVSIPRFRNKHLKDLDPNLPFKVKRTTSIRFEYDINSTVRLLSENENYF